MQTARARPDVRVLLAFFLVVVFLGVNFVAVRFSNQELPPFWGAALRFAVASLVLFVVAGFRKIPLPKGGSFRGAVLLGATAFGAGFAFIYWGLLTVHAATAAILFATVPVITFLMAAATGLEKFDRRVLVGAIIALAGVVLVFNEQLASNFPVFSLTVVFAGAVMAAVSTVVVKRFPKGHPIGMNAVGMAVGAVILLAASLAAGEPQRLPTLVQTWGALAWLVTSSITAFVLLVWVIYRWTASAASYSSLLSPLVTFVVASSIAGEAISAAFLVGSAIVLVGVYLGAVRA